MECLQFRRRVTTEPSSNDLELRVHEMECSNCARFRKNARSFDALIHEALLVDVPRYKEKEIPAALATSRRSGWLALAASIVVAAGVSIALHFPALQSERAVARDVAKHLEREPEAVDSPLMRVDRASVDNLLAGHQMRIAEDFGPIVYARICVLHGKEIAHLVVKGPDGLITVMLMPGEQLKETAHLTEASLVGRIVPTPGGNIAIIGHDHAVDPAAEVRIVAAVDWEA